MKFVVNLNFLMIVLFPVICFAENTSQVILDITLSPPVGTNDNKSPTLKVKSSEGVKLVYNKINQNRLIYGIGLASLGTKYNRNDNAINRNYSSAYNYLLLDLGYSYEINKTTRIDGVLYGGIGNHKFEVDGGSEIKQNGVTTYGTNIALDHKFKKFDNFGNLGVRIGMDLQRINVDDFNYEGRSFKSSELDNQYNLLIGLSLDF